MGGVLTPSTGKHQSTFQLVLKFIGGWKWLVGHWAGCPCRWWACPSIDPAWTANAAKKMNRSQTCVYCVHTSVIPQGIGKTIEMPCASPVSWTRTSCGRFIPSYGLPLYSSTGISLRAMSDEQMYETCWWYSAKGRTWKFFCDHFLQFIQWFSADHTHPPTGTIKGVNT